MKALPALLILFSFMPIAYAASDCEHSCCNTYNGWWDDDFDQCKGGDEGFSTCVSDCEAANYNYWAQQGPDTTGGTHYTCCGSAFVLASIGGALFLGRKN